MSEGLDLRRSQSHPLTRRRFLEATAATGVLGILAFRQAPVFAQKHEVSMLTWNHFVPASDERLKEIAADFSKRHNVNLRIDTIAHLQLPAKWATEVQTKAGHDMVFTYSEAPYLYEQYLMPMDDVVAERGELFFLGHRRQRVQPCPGAHLRESSGVGQGSEARQVAEGGGIRPCARLAGAP